MGLLSFLKRSKDEPRRDAAAATGAPDAVQETRARARRRLIGASVLLGLGIVGFPLLFETQPRPVPVDIPIEIPSKENAAPLPLPPKRASAPLARAVPPVITERAEDAGREVNPVASASASGSTPAVAEAPKADKPAAVETPKPLAAASVPKPKPAASASVAKADTERAKALLESRATAQAEAKPEPKPKPKPEPKPEAEADKPAPDDSGRFVVQVGAFADAAGARQARQKVEALGLKTYTQEVDVNGAKRIRVRVGPFASREAAAKVVGKVKAAGLPGALLTL